MCFDHEQGLFPNIINEAQNKGVDVACKIIPPDVFDKRAIDKNQIVFHDVKEKDSDGKIQEKWTGDFIFENEWQSFRKNSEIMEFKSVGKEFSGKKFTKVAVKVIDIFGNDTMRVMKVNF